MKNWEVYFWCCHIIYIYTLYVMYKCQCQYIYIYDFIYRFGYIHICIYMNKKPVRVCVAQRQKNKIKNTKSLLDKKYIYIICISTRRMHVKCSWQSARTPWHFLSQWVQRAVNKCEEAGENRVLLFKLIHHITDYILID